MEFASRYTRDGTIDFSINFDGMTPTNKYLISFDLTFNRNPMYNEEPLIRVLNSFSKNPKITQEEVMLESYEEFFDLICHFGIGIIIFPNLIL